MTILEPVALNAKAFAEFGEVIEPGERPPMLINQGLTERYHDLCTIDIAQGQVGVSIFRTHPIALPHQVRCLERHPLGSQAFVPLTDNVPFMVLVAPPGEAVAAQQLKLFISNGHQGVNIARNTWHHYLLSLSKNRSDFLVIDYVGRENNLVECTVQGQALIPVVYSQGITTTKFG